MQNKLNRKLGLKNVRAEISLSCKWSLWSISLPSKTLNICENKKYED